MISLQKVTKTYQHQSNQVDALKNINLEIKQGEFIAITGPSGSGKSTLLHIIGGLENPNQGKVKIANTSIQKMNDISLSKFRNENVGFIFQSFHLHPHLTVSENILLPQMFSEKKQQLKLAYILKETGLTARKKHLPSELSGGEQQRVAIGRALINTPHLLLADEPTGNLDSKTGKKILNLLTEIHSKQKTTMIIVTHDDKIAKLADRTIKIQDGKIHSQ